MLQSTSPPSTRKDSTSITNSDLPNPKLLRWAHSTCSKDQLDMALLDHNITAIEADIVMGHEENENKEVSSISQPVMAHPPLLVSDLTFEEFITTFRSFQDSKDSRHKHLKLDFKDVETIEPVLNTLKKVVFSRSSSSNITSDKTIFLNADILKGPGGRTRPLAIEANDFVEKCVAFTDLMSEDNRKRIAMSLGWRTDCRSFRGYTKNDVKEMKEIIDKYNLLERTAGVVLAVNARVLAKDSAPFDSILKEHPAIQLLVWTATGEPPISGDQISGIKEHFHSIGCEDQLGFDCQVASSVVSGVFYDNILRLVGLFWNAMNFIR